MSVAGRRSPVRSTIRWVLLGIAVVVALTPFLWMLRTALGPSQTAIDQSASLLPSSLTFDNFTNAWHDVDLGTALTNGVLVSGTVLLLQLVTSIMAGYAFACLHFRGRDALFVLVLVGMLIPPQTVAVPNYVTISGLGLADTRFGLVLPFAANAIGIFLMRQYMSTVPVSLLEAARMDGLGPWRTLWRVVLPQCTPAVAAVATFSFLVNFNEYLWPLLVARSPGNYTPPLALATFTTSAGLPDFAQLSAAALIISLPSLVVFLIAQRKLTAGLSGSGAAL
ncbi:MAG: multiple sugar transport system permease protein [Frankiaceae bacterium]|nr:multiple sugar transport system permease protein [Frankiaceae bacterium]MDQ1648366.1 multiple sugar transport system permease protein [Frankiaceae bacterium]